jgi:hypothetical protein
MGSPCKLKTSSAVVTDTPDNCVFRPEAIWYKPTGCDIECPSTFQCIADGKSHPSTTTTITDMNKSKRLRQVTDQPP